MLLDFATLLFFPALMLYAAFSDLLTMTIPNIVSIALAGLFLALAVASGLPLAEIFWHFVAGMAMIGAGFALFALGWIGGGDAKLAAATAIWLGPERFGDYALVASLFGGGLTVMLLAFRQWNLLGALARRSWIRRLHDSGTGVPYGIALAGTGLLLYPGSAVWLAAAAHP
ncbi:MAG: prepilin peptidase [Methylocapsa sp.]|nr:prepilin peptidase [Methylocapsa sp.]